MKTTWLPVEMEMNSIKVYYNEVNTDRNSTTWASYEYVTDLQTFVRIVLSAFALISSVYLTQKYYKNCIPGPFCLPIFGSILSIGRSPHLSFIEMQKKYGDVFRVQIGSHPVVILNGLQTIRQALIGKSETFAGRPDLFTFRLASEGKSMCFNSYSEQWKAHRKLSEKAMRLMTNRSSFVSNVLTREANGLVGKFKSRRGISFDPTKDVLWAVARVKYSFCYGDDQFETKDFTNMVDNTLALIDINQTTGANLINFFPWTQQLMKNQCSSIKDICNKILTITKRQETRHLQSYQKGQIRDVLDALMEAGSESKVHLEPKRLLHTVQEYLGAGLDVVYVSINWALLYLAEYKHIQTAIQKEIDAVQKTKDIDQKDMHRMPYTQAFIYEVLRHSCIVPFALPHSTTEDTVFQGHYIPTNTFVLVNMFSISHDPNLWETPNEFHPERYLEECYDGNFQLNKNTVEKYSPWGIGKRRCVGEQFSKIEIFLFLTSLLEKCDVVKPQNVSYDLTPEPGVVLKPKPFKISVEPRNSSIPRTGGIKTCHTTTCIAHNHVSLYDDGKNIS